ncbi:MAG TPA: carboxypeptidase-like regulatory domain-containing protein [Terriglobia bacterium]
MPPGEYTVSVSHAGFVLMQDPRRGVTASGFKIGLSGGQTLRNIVLPMAAAPVISGTVVGPDGQPLAAALVRAYVRQYTPYGTRMRVVKKGMTDDLGAFRLSGLSFGEYFVSAGYGDRERAEAVGKTQLSANVSRADDGYVTQFYDGTGELSYARPVRLAPDFDDGGVTIYLKEPARFRIHGQVVPPLAGVKIAIVPKGSDLAEATSFVQTGAGGAFEIRGVSPGTYLLLGTIISAYGSFSSDVMTLNVKDSDLDGIRMALIMTQRVSGGVTLDFGQPINFAAPHVRLVRSTIEFDQTLTEDVKPDGTFAFADVPAGEWDIVVEPIPPGMYVKSINSAGRNLLSGGNRLSGSAPIQIVVAPAPDTLDVQVTNGADPAIGAQVAVVPAATLRRRADRYFTGFTDSSGHLRLSALPPGTYTVYAFERIESGAYYALGANISGASPFRDRGVSVTLGDNGGKTIELKAIPAAETAGGIR